MRRNENFWKGYFIGLFVCIIITGVLCVLFDGCTTARLSGDDAGIVSANSRAVGRLEATVTELDRTITDSRERIGIVARAGERIKDGIDRLEYLFGEYEQEVGRLLDEIDRIRNEAESEGEAD